MKKITHINNNLIKHNPCMHNKNAIKFKILFCSSLLVNIKHLKLHYMHIIKRSGRFDMYFLCSCWIYSLHIHISIFGASEHWQYRIAKNMKFSWVALHHCTYIGNWYVKLKAYTKKNWFMHHDHEWLWQDVHTKSKSRKIDKKVSPLFIDIGLYMNDIYLLDG